jgi:TRAP transporter TAXI family solute receptor
MVLTRFAFVTSAVLSALLLAASPGRAQQTIDAGVTGFDVKRPVVASACPNGCPWGELGDFLREAMQPSGYDVILCRNCNRAEGPRLVAKASYPPELGGQDLFVGTTTRVAAPVDFGITASRYLTWAYDGLYTYAEDGPYANLRLIAKIEDPSYLLVAVKEESGITDLSQVAAQRLPVRILGGDSPVSQSVLDYYGLTKEAVTSWGGYFNDPIIAGQADDPTFDIVITENASPANNPESAYWTKISQKHQLRFLDIPEQVLERLASDSTLSVERVVVRWGLLKGVDRTISTVARSGHVVFSRDDMPEQAAYDVARAIDEHRGALKWFIRPYSYDTRTAWSSDDVPLHPGARRYYRDAGYLRGAGAGNGCPDASAGDGAARSDRSSGSCRIGRQRTLEPLPGPLTALALLLVRRWRRREVRLV